MRKILNILIMIFILTTSLTLKAKETPTYWNTYSDGQLLSLNESCLLIKDTFYIPKDPASFQPISLNNLSLDEHYAKVATLYPNRFTIDYENRSIHLYKNNNALYKAIKDHLTKLIKEKYIQHMLLGNELDLSQQEFLGHSIFFYNEGNLHGGSGDIFIRCTLYENQQFVKELYFHLPRPVDYISSNLNVNNYEESTTVKLLSVTSLTPTELKSSITAKGALLLTVDEGYFHNSFYSGETMPLLISGYYEQESQLVYVVWETQSSSALPALITSEHLLRSMIHNTSPIITLKLH